MLNAVEDGRKEPQRDDRPEIEKLLALLHEEDGFERQDARRALVRIGRKAVPRLIGTLRDRDKHVRWESAKALGEIRDPRAAPALVQSLEDRRSEVAWLAADALIALGRDALPALLGALENGDSSLSLLHGAHHVLRTLERDHLLNDETRAVLDNLRSFEPAVIVPPAAHRALASLEPDAREPPETGRE